MCTFCEFALFSLRVVSRRGVRSVPCVVLPLAVSSCCVVGWGYRVLRVARCWCCCNAWMWRRVGSDGVWVGCFCWRCCFFWRAPLFTDLFVYAVTCERLCSGGEPRPVARSGKNQGASASGENLLKIERLRAGRHGSLLADVRACCHGESTRELSVACLDQHHAVFVARQVLSRGCYFLQWAARHLLIPFLGCSISLLTRGFSHCIVLLVMLVVKCSP